jgi:ribonucleoside-diphosphate reductase alpha chain
VSQLTDAASGIHARHAPYYIRTVRADNKDPLCQMMKEMGFPSEPDIMKPEHTTVFSFPMKSPEHSVFRKDMTALQHLELWLTYQRHWCEHKPSITVTVKEHEWMEVGAWVYKHFDEVSGISFLPYADHSYQQAPYQDCTKEEYETLLAKMPKNADWNLLRN